MSPASFDALEIERYIGACLFSQNRPRNSARSHDVFQRPQVYHHQNGYVNFQSCPLVDRWAGGAPLISFAGPHRGHRRQHHEEVSNNHLARLAVHTQGAPLILTKSYNHRKNKPQRNNANIISAVQQTKVFENSNNKKHPKILETVTNNVKGVDSVSVTSDESSGSQNSETCLPRIIKPRKRRKKDRKPPPPHIGRSLNIQDEFSTDSTCPNVNATPLENISSYLPYLEPFVSCQPFVKGDDTKKCVDLLGDISETPKLHHSFEEVEEVEEVNGNQPVSTCQCRYCDPEGQIWDVDRRCYSPFLTPPQSFNFSSLFSVPKLDRASNGLPYRLSALSLKDETYKPSFSRSTSSSSTSSSSSTGDLEVSTEIVTSLNGHRDLEIKFWLSGAVDTKSSSGTYRE